MLWLVWDKVLVYPSLYVYSLLWACVSWRFGEKRYTRLSAVLRGVYGIWRSEISCRDSRAFRSLFHGVKWIFWREGRRSLETIGHIIATETYHCHRLTLLEVHINSSRGYPLSNYLLFLQYDISWILIRSTTAVGVDIPRSAHQRSRPASSSTLRNLHCPERKSRLFTTSQFLEPSSRRTAVLNTERQGQRNKPVTEHTVPHPNPSSTSPLNNTHPPLTPIPIPVNHLLTEPSQPDNR